MSEKRPKSKAKRSPFCYRGGADSASVLFALLEAKKKVTAYSFYLDGKLSTDAKLAEKTAHNFGVPFNFVKLPDDVQTLKEDCRKLARLGARKKTDFECVWPMLYAYRNIQEPIIASGVATDGFFCLSKKGVMHYKDRTDVFRNEYFSNPNAGQRILRGRLANYYGKTLFDPYYSSELFKAFCGTTWEELNRPKQKMPIRNAFPEYFGKIEMIQHSDLHKGDSGISEHFEKLLKTDLNRRGHKGVVGVYNDIVKGNV